MKINLITPIKNRRNNQLGFTLKKRKLKMIGLTPEQFFKKIGEIDWPIPRGKIL